MKISTAATQKLLLFFNTCCIPLFLLVMIAPETKASDTTLLFSHGLSNAEGRSVKKAADGSLYFVGYAGDSLGNVNAVLTKLDKYGSTIWWKSFGDSAVNQALYVNFSSEGNLVIVGEHVSNGNLDFEITLCDTAGNVVWQRRYGAGNKNESLQYVEPTADHGFLACGFTTQSNLMSNDFLVVKFDSLGYVSWQKEYGTPQNDYAKMLRVTPSGLIAISGDSYNGRDIDNMLVLADSAGNQIWQRFAGDDNDNGNQSVIINHQGHFVLCGESTTASSFLFDLYFAAFDLDGTFLWSKYMGGDGSEAGFSIVENAAHNYFVTGYSSSIYPGAPYTAYLLKLDSAFHPTGLKYFPQPDLTICYEAILTSDSTLALAGTSGTYFCLVLTSDSGLSQNFIEHGFVSHVSEPTEDSRLAKVYFSAKHVLTVESTSEYSESVQMIYLFNAEGKLLFKNDFLKETTIDVSAYQPQLLFWRVETKDRKAVSGQLFNH